VKIVFFIAKVRLPTPRTKLSGNVSPDHRAVATVGIAVPRACESFTVALMVLIELAWMNTGKCCGPVTRAT